MYINMYHKLEIWETSNCTPTTPLPNTHLMLKTNTCRPTAKLKPLEIFKIVNQINLRNKQEIFVNCSLQNTLSSCEVKYQHSRRCSPRSKSTEKQPPLS